MFYANAHVAVIGNRINSVETECSGNMQNQEWNCPTGKYTVNPPIRNSWLAVILQRHTQCHFAISQAKQSEFGIASKILGRK